MKDYWQSHREHDKGNIAVLYTDTPLSEELDFFLIFEYQIL